MSDGFTLSVPADAPYRGLASELAGRFARLSGGTDADASAVSVAVTDAVERAAAGADGADGADITIECRAESSGLAVTLRFAGRTIAVHHPLPARNV